MKTNILRKPVHPHAAYSLIAAALVAFFFTVSLRNSYAQNNREKGTCWVQNEKYFDYDVQFTDPDEGPGYVKTEIGAVGSYDELQKACTPEIFDKLASKLCAKYPGKYIERFESFDSENNRASYGWNGEGEEINCPTTKFEFPASQATIDSSKVEKINTIKVIEDEDTYGTPAAGYEENVKAKETILLPSATFEDDVLGDYTMYKNPFPDTNMVTFPGIAAAELYRRGVVGGFPDGQFKPDNTVNRAEAAKFLLLTKGVKIEDVKNDKKFPDVLEGQWYTKYVITAADEGIINGYPDGTFRPGNQVNTAEFLKMLSLAFDLNDEGVTKTNWTDVPADSWFAPYARIAYKYLLLTNRQLELKPAAPMTRGEVVSSIYQYLFYRNQKQ